MSDSPESEAIANLPQTVKDNWKVVSDLIYSAGYRLGRKEGYADCKADYTLGFRARFQTGNFILGFLAGMTIGSMLLILTLKGTGVLP